MRPPTETTTAETAKAAAATPARIGPAESSTTPAA